VLQHAHELGRPYPLTTVSWIDAVDFYAVHGAGRVGAIIKSFEVKTCLALY